jgi:poly(ADP-ribose) glycohydrolase
MIIAPRGKVSFQRQTLKTLPNWAASTKPLSKLTISDSLIEDAQGLLQVDFANKMIGGGVLGRVFI